MSRVKPSVIRVPAYTLHKPTNTARVRIGGRYHSLGRYGSESSYAKYQTLIDEWRSAGCPTYAAPPDPCISAIVLGYWKHLTSDRDESMLWNEKMALRTIRERYGLTRAADFGPRAFRALRVAMVDLGWCRGTVNHRASIIRAMFRWAVSEELIDAGVWHALQSVRGLRKGEHGAGDPDPVTPVAEPVIEATLAHLPQTVADMVRVQLLTGARPGEICAMTTGQIDTTGAVGEVGGVWQYTPIHHKTAHHGKSRVITIGPRAQRVLRGYLNTDLDAPIFSPSRSESDRREQRHAQRSTPLSCGNTPGSSRARSPKRSPGDRYIVASYRRAIARACEKAGVPVWSPNQLRHTRATEIRRDYGLEHAGAVMGHSKVETTQVYAERDLSLARRVAAETG